LSTSRSKFECPICKGKGQIPKLEDQKSTAVETEICQTCGGSGTLTAIEIKILCGPFKAEECRV